MKKKVNGRWKTTFPPVGVADTLRGDDFMLRVYGYGDVSWVFYFDKLPALNKIIVALGHKRLEKEIRIRYSVKISQEWYEADFAETEDDEDVSYLFRFERVSPGKDNPITFEYLRRQLSTYSKWLEDKHDR